MLEVYDAIGVKRIDVIPPALLKEFQRESYINGMKMLKFSLPINSPKATYLAVENRIRYDGDEYVIKYSNMDIKDVEILTVSCYSSAIDLSNFLITEELDLPDLDIKSILEKVLERTEWTINEVDTDITELRPIIIKEKTNVLEGGIYETLKLFGASEDGQAGPYVKFDTINKTVSVYSDIGEDRNVQIRYGKNLKGLNVRIDLNSIVTRLYPRGYDDLSISSVSGEDYIENFSFYEAQGYNVADPDIRQRLVRESTWEAPEFDDPQQLCEAAVKKLASLAWPKVTVNCKIVDLYAVCGRTLEKIELGDWITVIYNPGIEELDLHLLVKVTKITEYPNEPLKNEIGVGSPVLTITDIIKPALNTTQKIKKNRSTSNLLRGFINAAATTINGTRGLMNIQDNVIEFWEVDASGTRTGKGIRLTPGGLGITTDGGQTYDTAMTGLGVLANKVIVNELYALATDDGHTKLEASGLHVYDESAIERLIAGWWMDGATKRFGLNVKAQDGQTTLLDDRGILQTWQIQHADNLDSNHPLKIIFYIPPEANLGAGKRFKLSFTREWFRAYETGAASGGGSTRTSTSAGEHRHKVFEWIGGVWDDPLMLSTNTAGSHNHSINVNDGGNHQHRYWDEPVGANYTDYAGTHDHSASSGYSGSHGHNFTIPYIKTFRALKSSSGNDFWNVGIGAPDYEDIWTFGAAGDHNHTVTIPDHTHELIFGIYESTAPTDITITIDGQNVTDNLGGPFNENKTDLDLSPFITSTGWHTLELGSATLGRLNASLFIQVFMHV